MPSASSLLPVHAVSSFMASEKHLAICQLLVEVYLTHSGNPNSAARITARTSECGGLKMEYEVPDDDSKEVVGL